MVAMSDFTAQGHWKFRPKLRLSVSRTSGHGKRMRPLTLMWGNTPRLIQFETVLTVTFNSSATCALVKSRLGSFDSYVFIFTTVLSAALNRPWNARKAGIRNWL